MEMPNYASIPSNLSREAEIFLSEFGQKTDSEKLVMWADLQKNIRLLFEVHPLIQDEMLRLACGKK